MPMIPAFCDTCGTIFPSGFMFENSSNISFSNCRLGPCPRCGGTGHIPDGVFNVIGDTIQLLSGPHRTVEELQRLVDILRRIKKEELPVEELEKQVTAGVPALSGIMSLLPRDRSELYGFLSVLIAIITFIMPFVQNQNQSKIEINQVINYIYQQPSVAATNENNISNFANTSSNNSGISNEKTPIRVKKIGRNEKCPCGSGNKYKKCCGK